MEEIIKVGLVSLGCSKNLVDGENMLGILAADGFEIVNAPDEADVLIVNTCAFIDSAKQEAIDTILEMAEYKAQRCRLLVATGCLAERYADDIKAELPEVDCIVGVGDFPAIAEVIRQGLVGKKPVLTGHCNAPIEEGLPRMVSTPSYTAFLKIAEGCDNRCTYCAIPYIRGAYRSRTMEAVLEEATALAEQGVKELIVIAQDTTYYGTDLYHKPMLPELLRRLCELPVAWIRVHYCYPERTTPELLAAFQSPKVCAYFDIPIQHCNDQILKRMGRHTTKEEITEVIASIRRSLPHAVLRTSLIVGFPGETEEQFQELCEFVRQTRFDRMGVFMYSQEEGTPAARLPMQVDEEIKQERYDRLMEIAQEIAIEKNHNKIGSVQTVLVEGFEDYFYYGRTYGDSPDIDQKVYFAAEAELTAGMLVPVTILNIDGYDLVGKLASTTR